MSAYTLYLGLIDRDGIPVASCYIAEAARDTARTFGGYTATETTGGYTTVAGALVTEPSMRFEIVTDAPVSTVRAWAERLRILANQETVLLTSHTLNSAEFIGVSAPVMAQPQLTELRQ